MFFFVSANIFAPKWSPHIQERSSLIKKLKHVGVAAFRINLEFCERLEEYY